MNLDLLTHYVEWVETQAELPESEREWDQRDWGRVTECGTTYCVAGKIASDLGWYPTRHDDGGLMFAWLSRNPNEEFSYSQTDVEDIARDALGLTEYQGDMLFDGGNTAGDVRRIAEEMAGQPLVREKTTA